MLLQLFAIFAAFLPETLPKRFSIDENMEFTEEKHVELECTYSFDELKFTNLTLTCFSCYRLSEKEFESCRSKCFSTLKYKECITERHRSDEDYYFKLANEYNRKEIFPLETPEQFLKERREISSTVNNIEDIMFKTDSDFGCPFSSDNYTLMQLVLTCSFCYYNQIIREFEECSARCFSTWKFQECVNGIPSNGEYFLNLSNIINNRTIFPLQVNETSESVSVKTIQTFPVMKTDQLVPEATEGPPQFYVFDYDVTFRIHKAIGCTSQYQMDTFQNLTHTCYACYASSKEDFHSCRWKCFSEPKFRECVRNLHPSNAEYYFKLANDYNQEEVHPVKSTEQYPEKSVPVREFEPLPFTVPQFEHFTINKYVDVSIKKHEELGCTSKYDYEMFYNLTNSCYTCYSIKPTSIFDACRSECFSTLHYQGCLLRRFNIESRQYYFNLSNDYNGRNIFPIETYPALYLAYNDFTENKHEEIGCTLSFIDETFYNLTMLCYSCYSYLPSTDFELCRSECFSTGWYRQCALKLHPDRYEKFLKLAYNYRKGIKSTTEHPLASTSKHTVKSTTKSSLQTLGTTPVTETSTVKGFLLNSSIHLTLERHNEIGCTSQFVSSTFDTLSLLCYSCYGSLSETGFNFCRSACFSTEWFKECAKLMYPLTYEKDLKMAYDYEHNEAHLTNSPEKYTTTNLATKSPEIFYLHLDDFSIVSHRQVRCTSPYEETDFTLLTLRCYRCYNTTKTDYDWCRSKCFSTSKFPECIRKKYPSQEAYYLRMVNFYNQKEVHPIDSNNQPCPGKTVSAKQLETTPITERQFEYFLINKYEDGSFTKHEELGCTSQFKQEAFYNLTSSCFWCYPEKPVSSFEACRSECFSTLHYQGCVSRLFSASKEYYFNLANDYNGKKIFPIQTDRPVFYLTYRDFIEDKHREIGCTSQFNETNFYNLTILCYSCHFYPPNTDFEMCRTECFSTEVFRECAQELRPNSAEDYLNLSSNYS